MPSDIEEPVGCRLLNILRIKPSNKAGQIKIADGPEGQGVEVVLGKDNSFVVDLATTGNNHELCKLIRPVIDGAVRGDRCVILMQGGTGSGKTYTLQGDVSLPMLASRARDQSLIQFALHKFAGDAGLHLSVHEINMVRRRLVLDKGDFKSPAHAFRSYIESGRKLETAVRKGAGGLSGSGLSSRSWVHIVISNAAGGQLDIFDIPGKERSLSDDSETLNNIYDLIQSELTHLARLAKKGVRWSKDQASCSQLANARSAPIAHIHTILEHMLRATSVAVIGCIDPSERVRAITSLRLLHSMMGTVIPPLPAVSNSPSPSPSDALASQPISTTPTAAIDGVAAVVSSNQTPGPLPIRSESGGMWFVDNEHREQYLSRIRQVMLDISASKEGDKLEDVLKRSLSRSEDLSHRLLHDMPKLLKDLNNLCEAEYTALDTRRSKLVSMLLDCYAARTRGRSVIKETLEGFLVSAVTSVEVKLKKKFQEFFDRNFDQQDGPLRALREQLERAYLDRLGDHTALVRQQVKSFALQCELDAQAHQSARQIQLRDAEIERNQWTISGLFKQLRGLRFEVQQAQSQLQTALDENAGLKDQVRAMKAQFEAWKSNPRAITEICTLGPQM